MIIQLQPRISRAALKRDFQYYFALANFYDLKGRVKDAEATRRAALTKLANITRSAQT